MISGPAGVGKTSVANEVSAQLRAADIAHAVIDTDALDDVYPVPDEQWRLTERNLASVWLSFRLQANELAEEAVPQAPVIETDERTVPDIAAEIVELLGWR